MFKKSLSLVTGVGMLAIGVFPAFAASAVPRTSDVSLTGAEFLDYTLTSLSGDSCVAAAGSDCPILNAALDALNGQDCATGSVTATIRHNSQTGATVTLEFDPADSRTSTMRGGPGGTEVIPDTLTDLTANQAVAMTDVLDSSDSGVYVQVDDGTTSATYYTGDALTHWGDSGSGPTVHAAPSADGAGGVMFKNSGEASTDQVLAFTVGVCILPETGPGSYSGTIDTEASV